MELVVSLHKDLLHKHVYTLVTVFVLLTSCHRSFSV